MPVKPVVVVAMSGGVDSSVAAALLVEQGYTVIGMMLRLWSEPDADALNRCCSPAAMDSARRVASLLSIPFYVLDARQVFYENVVQPFIYDYTHDRTPNPCVACNRTIRWGFLFDQALTAGAEVLATGHYARSIRTAGGAIQLLRGVDPAKDQSYVLHVLSQAHLQHTLFPLGEFTKSQVRELAHRFNLPVAEKPDSQDLCFVGAGNDYRQLLARHAPESLIPGEIVNRQGVILGYHQGLPLYTLGQRKGLRLAAQTPQYVLEKDSARNTLVVGPADQLFSSKLVIENVNWIAGSAPADPLPASAKVRYKSPDVPCQVTQLSRTRFQVKLSQPVRDITPGQAAVLYNGDICLGGGIISDPLRN